MPKILLLLQIIKDKLLMLGVASLVAIDLVILATYTLVEGVQGNLVAQQVVNREQPMIIEKVKCFLNSYIYQISVLGS